MEDMAAREKAEAAATRSREAAQRAVRERQIAEEKARRGREAAERKAYESFQLRLSLEQEERTRAAAAAELAEKRAITKAQMEDNARMQDVKRAAEAEKQAEDLRAMREYNEMVRGEGTAGARGREVLQYSGRLKTGGMRCDWDWGARGGQAALRVPVTRSRR
jgi:FKBP-type peptidyl-prolyl cis-trans isomerase